MTAGASEVGENHGKAGGQDNADDARGEPAQGGLGDRVRPHGLEGGEDQEDDDEGRQHHGEGGQDRAEDAALAAAHVGGQIHHDGTRGALAHGDHIGEAVLGEPAVGEHHVPDQGDGAVGAAEGEAAHPQKAQKQVEIDHAFRPPFRRFPSR